MIEYITEKEYERRYEHWRKKREPIRGAAVDRLQTRLESKQASGVIARAALDGDWRAVKKWLQFELTQAVEDALRTEFSNRFVAHPTGPDRNAIAFSGDWRNS